MKVRVSTDVETGVVTYLMWCPGCAEEHAADRSQQFDGNRQRPTFKQSILAVSPSTTLICHSFVRNGMWEFLTDSEHKLVGKTVPMVELPQWLASAGSSAT